MTNTGFTEHLWQGRWIDETEAEKLLTELSGLTPLKGGRPLTAPHVLAVCARLSASLASRTGPEYVRLSRHLTDTGMDSGHASQQLAALATMLSRESLESRLIAELGNTDPQRLIRVNRRPGGRTPAFEAWAPLGLVAHIVADDDPMTAISSAVDGLLTGNVNVIKASPGQGLFIQLVLEALGRQDAEGRVAERLIVLCFPASRARWLQRVTSRSDVVALLGNADRMTAHAAPARIVQWGSRISIAYLTAGTWSDEQTLDDLAASIYRRDQRSTRPYVVYLDTNRRADTTAFARRLGAALDAQQAKSHASRPSVQERWEIDAALQAARSEVRSGLAEMYEGEAGAWRIVVDDRSALHTSQLFRSVWVRPLPRDMIHHVLRPMRHHLQTVGLAADRREITELSTRLFAAGALRITPVGSMGESYAGEPRDGRYPLQCYSRRITARLPAPTR